MKHHSSHWHAALTGLYFVLSVGISLPAFSIQTCNQSIPLTSPDTRFTQNSPYTPLNSSKIELSFTDTQTGLIWARCPMGWTDTLCNDATTDSSVGTWEEAINFAENSEFHGDTDWRVPNIKELQSLVEYACFNPAINRSIFPKTVTTTAVWSSTPDRHNDKKALTLDFFRGQIVSASKPASKRLLLVRDED